MIFASVLRNRSVKLLASKAIALQRLSLPSVTGVVQNHHLNSAHAMSGTAQSQTSAVRVIHFILIFYHREPYLKLQLFRYISS